MDFSQEQVIGGPVRSDHGGSTPSGKFAALPKYRYAVRVVSVLVAIAGDALLILAAALTATLIRFQSFFEPSVNDLLLIIVPGYFLAAVALNCYQLATLRDAIRSAGRALFALAIAAGLTFAAAFGMQVGAVYSRLGTGVMLVTAAAYLAVGHVLYKLWLDRLSDLLDPRVLILGAAFEPTKISANIDRIIPSERPDAADPSSLERAFNLLQHADRVILAFDDAAERTAWTQFIRLIGVDAELIEPSLQNITVLGMQYWQGIPTLVVARGALDFGERAVKRAFDLAISVLLLVLFGPLILLLMLLVKLESRGPAIFVQSRIGRNNRAYRCYKLRTMYADQSDPQGARSTGRDDERVTRLGKFLRRTSLDELPQLWNVIVGDMSLVGPRPHALGSVAEGALFWEAVPDYWTRHAMRPGITGLAQVRGLRGATHTRSDIERRVGADLEYINSWSIWLDIKILLQTIRVIFHRNAF
jgi:exopolysaccharide biosynthesis polyprenyl glycosylphosphotransferase